MIPFPESAPTPVGWTRVSRVRIRPRRRPDAADPRSWNLTLVSAGTGVPLRLAVRSPGLLAAVIEDLEWRLALEELRARRPHRWQRSATAAWNSERDRLEKKRQRIAEIAAEAVSAL